MSRGVSGLTRASSRTAPSGTPVHSATPIAPYRHWVPEATLPMNSLKNAPAVAGALDVGGHGPRGQPQQVVERELDRAFDGFPLDSQPPRAQIDRGDVRVLSDEELAGRGQIAAQRLERVS
jgi:hypothetical protein